MSCIALAPQRVATLFFVCDFDAILMSHAQIHYFDAMLNTNKGEPMLIKKAVCMHEEDHGMLWKHVEYRTGHSEVRRSRRLVLSFVATVDFFPV